MESKREAPASGPATIMVYDQEIRRELADPKVMTALVETTFKGLSPDAVKKAVLAGMIRGFSFKNFLQKDVYAISYGSSFSLVTSIDYARKIGMRSGICYNGEPVFEIENGKIISCSVTVKRMVTSTLGEFTAKVYFDEYDTKKNQWVSKPKTMIAKVAEMHALRKACPEEMAQMYAEEEFQKEAEKPAITIDAHREKLSSAKNLTELGTFWSALPIEAKKELAVLKDELKEKLKAPEPAEAKAPEKEILPPEKFDENTISYDNL